jgi:hypothetical protein
MSCTVKTVIIIGLVLLILFLYMKNKPELFTAEDYKKQIGKQLTEFDAKKIKDNYNYNPIIPQCPEKAEETISWDPNTKICRAQGNIIERECPKDMIREGDYCYLKCDPDYIRGNGICWRK